MRQEVSQDARAVRIILPPAMVMLCVEWAVRNRAEPCGPVDGLAGHEFRLDLVVIPLAIRRVAHIGILRENQLPDLAVTNQFCCRVPLAL